MTSRQPLSVFLHIPKTAGTSFNTLLTREYGRNSIAHVPAGKQNEGTRYYNGLDGKKKNSLALVRDHILYGLHHSIDRPVPYFTILREPISRIQSFFNQIANQAALRPSHRGPAYEAIRHWKGAEAFSSTHPTQLDNYMVRAISGVDFMPSGCNEEVLNKAIENLDAMPAFGLYDMLYESISILRREPHRSVIPLIPRTKFGNPKRIRLTPVDHLYLQKQNEFDTRLDHHAQDRFQAMARRDPSLTMKASTARFVSPAITHVDTAARYIGTWVRPTGSPS